MRVGGAFFGRSPRVHFLRVRFLWVRFIWVGFLRARSFGAFSPGEQALRGREQGTGGWLLREPGSAIGVALMNLSFGAALWLYARQDFPPC